MTNDKKSRRRFLADMLFLGGGVTAAALIGNSFRGDPPPEPAVTGPGPQPATTPGPSDIPPQPQPDGGFVVTKGESIPPTHRPKPYQPSSAVDGDFEIGTIQEVPPVVKGSVPAPAQPTTD